MEINQKILNNLEQPTDSYAIENWEFLKKSLLRCMIASNSLDLSNMFAKQNNNSPYNDLLQNLNGYNSIKMRETLDKIFNFTIANTPNIYEDIQKAFLRQKNIFPNITDENPMFQNACNLLIEKYENFIYEHLNLLNYIYINLQGPTNDSLHFELNINENENMLRKADYTRSKAVNPKRRRFMSNFQIAAFYDRNLLKIQNPPNEKTLLYWIAFDNLIKLNNEEKTKLAQLLNTNDNSLSDEQQEIKHKILNDDEFKNKIITNFKQSFQPWPKEGITEITLKNINDNLPDKNHVVYILHAPEENLTELEKQFKFIFLANPIQEIYAQFYKNFHKVDEVPNDKLLTEEQIKAINDISSKVMRSSLIKYDVAKSAKNFFDSLNSYQINISDFSKLSNWFKFPSNTGNNNEAVSEYINNIMQNPVNLSEKNQKAIERIKEIKKLTFLYNPEENFPDTLTKDQETALIDLYDLCFKRGDQLSSISPEKKIESLKYTKENDEFFNKKIENPEFTKLDEDIKEFIRYKEILNYDTEYGLTKEFNNLPESKSIDISQYLSNNFKTLIENFDPKLPSDEELNTELENLFENTFDEIEEQYIPFEKWRTKHQEEITNKVKEITEENWQNFSEKGNGFLKAVYNGELNTYFNDEKAVKILSFAITAKLSCYPNIKHKILNKLITSKKLSPQIKTQLCIDNNITKKKYWPKILGIIAGITLGILGIGIALATGGIGTAILGMIGTIIASHTAIFATIASIGIAIGATITGIFSKKVNEDKSINSIINPKSKNGYILLNPNEISNAQENLNDMNKNQETSFNGKIQKAEETSKGQRQPDLDSQTQSERIKTLLLLKEK